MKKILKLFIFSFALMLIFANSVKAVLVDEGIKYVGTVTIRWVDFDDMLKMRPDKISLPLYESYDFERKIYLNLEAKDAEISYNENTKTTDWVYHYDDYIDVTGLLPKDLNDRLHVDFKNDPIPAGYVQPFDSGAQETDILYSSSSREFHGDLTIWFIKNIQKDYYVKAYFNDDNARDDIRYVKFKMEATNATVLAELENDYTFREKRDFDEYYFQTIPYLVGDFDSSEVLDPIKYELKILDDFIIPDDYEYSVYLDEDDYIIYTINHKARTIKVPINVEWNDNDNKNKKRPDKLVIKALNQDGEVEKEIEITNENDWQEVYDLYENMKYSYGKDKVIYTLDIEDDSNYKFVVNGDNGGFEILAEYIGEEIEEVEEIPPETSDKGLIYIFLLIGSLIIMELSYKLYLKRI